MWYGDSVETVSYTHLDVYKRQSVYRALLDQCSTAYVTKIEAAFPAADCWFPDLDSRPEWRISEESESQEEDGVKFRYVTYRKEE